MLDTAIDFLRTAEVHYLIEAVLLVGLVWAHLDLDWLRRENEKRKISISKTRQATNWIGLHMADPPPDKATRELPIVRPPSTVDGAWVQVPRPTHRDPEPKELEKLSYSVPAVHPDDRWPDPAEIINVGTYSEPDQTIVIEPFYDKTNTPLPFDPSPMGWGTRRSSSDGEGGY